MRVALGVEYEGSGFCGWQTQPDHCGVQDVLQVALSRIAGEAITTVCAGRTDAGVHALAQVVHFECQAERPDTAWTRGVNALLPPAIAVTWARRVSPEFNARFSATARHYRYILLNHPVRNALDHGRVGWYHIPLDMAAMCEAAVVLVGKHDFSAFRSSECQAKSPIRQLTKLTVTESAPYVYFDFCANGFLHHMVRNIVGSLVYIGSSRRPSVWMAELLASRNRALAAPTFDAAGLYLTGVDYDNRWGLPISSRVAAGMRR